MAWDMHTEGLTEVSEMLGRLGDRAQDVAVGALFDGAGIVANAFSKAANSIVTEPFHYLAKPELTGTKRYPSPEEKAAVVGRTGIATFRKNGSEVDTIVGITGDAGYVTIGGKKKAVRMIARSIESGTSFMSKQPVFRKAVNSVKGDAKTAIVGKAEEMFEKIINGD